MATLQELLHQINALQPIGMRPEASPGMGGVTQSQADEDDDGSGGLAAFVRALGRRRLQKQDGEYSLNLNNTYGAKPAFGGAEFPTYYGGLPRPNFI